MGGGKVTATFYVGDAVTVMNTLPEKSVDLILTSPPFLALRSYLPQDHPDKALEGGSQSTPGEYVDWLLDVVEACAQVLAPHGSLCLELGDTYSGSGGAGGDYAADGLREGQPKFRQVPQYRVFDKRGILYDDATPVQTTPNNGGTGWPLAKSLSLIPETFRFAMVYGTNPHTGRQTEPWRLRNVIRWVRPNPPVGALGDKFRPATSELMVFCKAKDRFFDLDAVRVSTPPLDWWNLPSGGYPGAHYAVWPPELLVKPIKAMCPEKVCRRCGEASRRISENTYTLRGEAFESPKSWNSERQTQNAIGVRKGDIKTHVETLGFSDCGHDDYRPGIVLDPFAGSGTTLAVATGHGRDAIGIDLDERNYELSLDRVGPLILQRGEIPDGAAPKS